MFRIEQPWHVAGKKVAARPTVLDEADPACIDAIRVRTPIVLGGRSAGARVACRSATALGAVGCSRWRSRCTRRAGRRRPGSPSCVGAACRRSSSRGSATRSARPTSSRRGLELTAIPDADHGFKVPKRAVLSQEETYALIVEAVVEWVTARVA